MSSQQPIALYRTQPALVVRFPISKLEIGGTIGPLQGPPPIAAPFTLAIVGFGAIAMSQEKQAVRPGNRRQLNSEFERTNITGVDSLRAISHQLNST